MTERVGGRRARPATPILHVDMDAFFVAVELLDRPELVGRPVIVGGTGGRGVVASASYEARAAGVGSAMPTARARRLCPDAVVLPGRHARYEEVSARVFDLFREHTPLVEGISLDEAFLDVAGAGRLLGPPEEVAHRIRRRVRDELGLGCSVGVAPRKLTAKLASEAAKPVPAPGGPRPGPGVVVVAPERELSFLHALPVGALWGVGPATRARLERFAVRTVGDLAALPVDVLGRALGAAQGRHLHDLAWARDDRPVVPERRPKSVGHEETYAADVHDAGTLEREAVRLSDAVGARLRRSGLAGRTVQLKVRFGDFRTVTRAATLPSAVDTGTEVARAVKALLGGVDPSPGVRLLGVSVSGLADGPVGQLALDDADGAPWRDATRALDDVRARFGDDAIGPAALVGAQGLRARRRGDQRWGPVDGDPGRRATPGGEPPGRPQPA